MSPKLAAIELRFRNNEQASDTLKSIGDSVITSDATGRITYLNAVAEHLTGWSAEEAVGQSLDTVLPLISEVTRLPIENTSVRCLAEDRAIDLEDGVLLVRRDGTEVPIGDSTAPIRNRAGAVVGVVMVLQDESEKRRVGHQLSHEASHDVLTGLINRREFERRLKRVVGDLATVPSVHAVLYLDLDRFKLINDICGHEAGDAVLKGLSPLLGRHLRKRDTMARLGGDEFGVLLENCPLAEAERIAENLRAEIEQYRFEWTGQVFSIGVSIGLLPVTTHIGGVDAVLRAADAACYLAKEGGGNRVHLEWSSRDPAEVSHMIAGPYLRLTRAIDENLFQLYAQPIVSLQPELGARRRLEILLRLRDDHGRMQSAAEFLPEAERYHLMPAIDQWVVRSTIAMLGQRQVEHPETELPVCSINLSASALIDGRLMSILERQLANHAIPAETLCFEISESAALANPSQAARFFSRVRAIGCLLAIEDCERGVASLTYLKTFPVTFLKIGGCLVRDVVADPMYGSIISAVNQVGLSMGVFTVVKHVGSEEVLHKVRALGIGYAQGRALIPPIRLTDSEGRMSMPGLRRSA